MSERRFERSEDFGGSDLIWFHARKDDPAREHIERFQLLPFDSRRLPRAMFGYDRDATHELFDSVAWVVDQLGEHRASLLDDLEELSAKLARYHATERALGQALRTARKDANEIREAAREDASRIVKSAERKARRIARNAEHAAKAEAREIVRGATRERDRILSDVDWTQRFAVETHEDLLHLLESALKWFERGSGPGKPASSQPPLP